MLLVPSVPSAASGREVSHLTEHPLIQLSEARLY